MDYYKNRKALSAAAQKHHQMAVRDYAEKIRWSVEHTIVYGGDAKMPTPSASTETPKVLFISADSVYATAKATKEFAGKKVAVLNFASYQNPGGKYLEGSSAQEEMLCHASTLYECLDAQRGYYDWNKQHKNHALYTDRALYIPSVSFKWDEYVCEADVITCAAPNRTAYTKYFSDPDADQKNTAAMRSRITFIKAIAEENHVDVLILGAFGCGVFGQDQDEVAALFQEVFRNSSVPVLVFAVPAGINAKNAEAFRRLFG